MKKSLIVTIAVILLLGVIAIGLVILRGDEDTWLCSNGQWVKHGQPSAPMPTKACDGGAIACTMEAKICPDGSAVGRTGSNCEFASCPTTSTQMANPASVNCQEKGGTLEIITVADGSQSGMCKFSDGSQCEEWAFFRGECQVGTVKSNDLLLYTNNQSDFSFLYPIDYKLYKQETSGGYFYNISKCVSEGCDNLNLGIAKSDFCDSVSLKNKYHINSCLKNNSDYITPTREIFDKGLYCDAMHSVCNYTFMVNGTYYEFSQEPSLSGDNHDKLYNLLISFKFIK